RERVAPRGSVQFDTPTLWKLGNAFPLRDFELRRSDLRMTVAPLPWSPSNAASNPTPVHRLGEQAFDLVADVGDVAVFALRTLVWMFRRRSSWSVLVPNFYAIGVSSVPVVAITGTFIGM